METPKHTLADIRGQIDTLDREIIRLIAERQQRVIAAGSLKSDEAAVRAPDRVEQVIAKVRAVADDVGASPQVVETTYRAMIGAFIDHELAHHREG
ncbi:chorismate mutase [Corynebacterium kalidii]